MAGEVATVDIHEGVQRHGHIGIGRLGDGRLGHSRRLGLVIVVDQGGLAVGQVDVQRNGDAMAGRLLHGLPHGFQHRLVAGDAHHHARRGRVGPLGAKARQVVQLAKRDAAGHVVVVLALRVARRRLHDRRDEQADAASRELAGGVRGDRAVRAYPFIALERRAERGQPLQQVRVGHGGAEYQTAVAQLAQQPDPLECLFVRDVVDRQAHAAHAGIPQVQDVIVVAHALAHEGVQRRVVGQGFDAGPIVAEVGGNRAGRVLAHVAFHLQGDLLALGRVGRAIGAHEARDMAVFVDIDHEETELAQVVAAQLFARLDAEELGVVLAEIGGRRQRIGPHARMAVQEERVHVPGEQGLHAGAGGKLQQAAARPVVDIVVMVFLVRRRDERRVVREQEQPPAGCLFLGEPALQELPLRVFLRQS